MPQAVDALERLIEIEGRIPPLLAQLAQIRFFMAERELTDEVQALVDETLAQDPRQPTVLGLLGVNAFDNGDYEQAIDHWRRAIANIEDPNTVTSLREGIRVAQERLGIEPEQTTAGSRWMKPSLNALTAMTRCSLPRVIWKVNCHRWPWYRHKCLNCP